MHEASPQPPASSSPGAHPLVKILLAALEPCEGKAVIEIGSGRGRNTQTLRAAGCSVTAITDDAIGVPLPGPDGAYDAALSTHGFFHGRPADARALCSETARVLRSGSRAYVTLTSTGDARCGQGTIIDERTYAPDDGPEAGVPHVYFDEAAARDLFAPWFFLETLHERNVGAVVGRWAHGAHTGGMRHWFVVARKL